MSFQFSFDLNPLSVYAAIVATAALIFCFVQWYRSGPRLTGRAIGNMKVHPDPTNRTYINLTVYNRGSRKTTVTGIAVAAYRSRWATVTGDRNQLLAVQRPLHVELPLSIEAGQYFTAGIPQAEDLVQTSRDHHLYIEVSYVDSDHPLMIRVRPIRDAPQTKGYADDRSIGSAYSTAVPRRSYTSSPTSLETPRNLGHDKADELPSNGERHASTRFT